jgi:hypothetical protein
VSTSWATLFRPRVAPNTAISNYVPWLSLVDRNACRRRGGGGNVQCVFLNELRRVSSLFPPNDTRILTGTELHTSRPTRARCLRPEVVYPITQDDANTHGS